MNQALEELKAAMKPEHVIKFEMKLRQGEIIKSDIRKFGPAYAFEFLVGSRYDDRLLIVGYYSRRNGITYQCDASIGHLKMLLGWAKAD